MRRRPNSYFVPKENAKISVVCSYATFTFSIRIFEWRGPVPFYFGALPEPVADDIHLLAHEFSYGWGCISIEAAIQGRVFTTAILPKDGGYLLPFKKAVRADFGLLEGDSVQGNLTLVPPGGLPSGKH